MARGEAQIRWCDENADNVRANKKRWREENPEKVRAASRRYRKNHRKKVKEMTKRWRRENVDLRNAFRKKNYEKGAKYKKNHRTPWTQEDIARIISPDRSTDRELAKELGRTVQAIQTRRATIATLSLSS